MAYEYEIKIPMWLEDGRWLNMNVDDKVLDELQEVYRKAKAFDEMKKHVDEEGDSYMVLYRQTKDPTYSLLNIHYDNLLGFIEEMEDK